MNLKATLTHWQQQQAHQGQRHADRQVWFRHGPDLERGRSDSSEPMGSGDQQKHCHWDNVLAGAED